MSSDDHFLERVQFSEETTFYVSSEVNHCNVRIRGYIDAPMLTCVWQELEYRSDVCRVTHGAHIEHL